MKTIREYEPIDIDPTNKLHAVLGRSLLLAVVRLRQGTQSDTIVAEVTAEFLTILEASGFAIVEVGGHLTSVDG